MDSRWLLIYDYTCMAMHRAPDGSLSQTAAEYAADRADERGWPWADAAAHLASLREHSVDHMGSGVLFGVQHCEVAAAADAAAASGAAAGGAAAGGVAAAAGGVAAAAAAAAAAGIGGDSRGGGTSHPMEGAGGETENLVERAGFAIRRVCEQMLDEARD